MRPIVAKKHFREGWRIGSDEVIGGFSVCSCHFIHGSGDLQKIQKLQEFDLSHLDSPNKPNFTPFIRWMGTIDTRIGERSRATRSGYCAIQSPSFAFDGAPLQNMYNALEINCRTDGRLYTLNLKVASYFPDELYQGHISIPPMKMKESDLSDGGEFSTLVIPFRELILTAGGRLRDTQRQLDGAIRVEHLGFILMDGNDGDFQFDLARIRAVNLIDGKIVGD